MKLRNLGLCLIRVAICFFTISVITGNVVEAQESSTVLTLNDNLDELK